jgi:hypothetical protein
MKSRNLNQFLILFLFIFAPLQSAKASTLQVEVIIFQTLALSGWTEEYWPDDKPAPVLDNITQLNGQDGYAKRLPNSKLSLTKEVEKMTNERGYDVLAHFGWRQPANTSQQAKPILIDSQLQQRRQGVSNLLGTLKIYQGRYAHIDIDLELERRIPGPTKQAFAQHQQLSTEWLAESWRFHIKESRRIKSGQLHYIDHPIFGILVKIDTVR